ncbi:MAG TPA: hypothetical protein VGR89_01740, partial [Puia sp.]|nr:hypothetical protein [Puia sp.]
LGNFKMTEAGLNEGKDKADGPVKRSVSRPIEFEGYRIQVITEWWGGEAPVPGARLDPDAPGDYMTNSIRNMDTRELTGPF